MQVHQKKLSHLHPIDFQIGGKMIIWGKKECFQQMLLGQQDIHTQKNEIEPNPYFTPHTKSNSKWITDLNIWATSIELLEESIAVNDHDIGLGSVFLAIAPKAQGTR